MRITGGQYGGRILEAPKDSAIRPTSDKVRLAVFNMLESRGLVADSVVLDAFCGTGALGLEALSRGALCCTFIDKNRGSLDLCRRNHAALKMTTKDNFLLKDAAKTGDLPSGMAAANLVFLDPPYNKDLIAACLPALDQAGWIAPDAYILAESEKGYELPADLAALFQVELVRDYGDTRVMLLHKNEGEVGGV